MPLNGTGTYSPPTPEYPAIPGTYILASDFNAIISDLGSALSLAIYSDGQQTYTANQPMGGFGLTGLGSLAGDTINVTATTALNLPATANGVTAATGNSSTKLATTAFVQGVAFSSALPTQTGNEYNWVTTNGTDASWTNQINFARGSVVMDATLMDLWAQPNIIDGTGGAVTITNIAAAPRAGASRRLYPIAGSVITHGATFSVQGGANQTASTGDIWDIEAITTTTFQVQVIRSDGTALSAGLITAVASGALSNGDMVVINSDGTASVVAGSAPYSDAAIIFDTGNVAANAVAYDAASGKVVVAYNTGSFGKAIVGSISAGVITFGTAVTFNAALSSYTNIVYDPDTAQVVIGFRDGGNSNYGTAIVGAVSGTSISFGAKAVFQSAATEYIQMAYDTANNKVVIYYTYAPNNYGTAVVGTVSGTGISFGTPVQPAAYLCYYPSIAFDSTNGVVVVTSYNALYSGVAVSYVGTVSGTSISFGAASRANSAAANGTFSTYCEGKNVIALIYRQDPTMYLILGRVISGTVTYGAPIRLVEATLTYAALTYDAVSELLVISISALGNDTEGQYFTVSIQDLVPRVESAGTFVSTQIAYLSQVNTPDTGVVISYRDSGASGKGTITQFYPEPTTAKKYVGVSAGAYADTDTAVIQIVGAVDDAQTGLTPGASYYVQPDGTINTAQAVPVVFAGTAISTTELLVKG